MNSPGPCRVWPGLLNVPQEVPGLGRPSPRSPQPALPQDFRTSRIERAGKEEEFKPSSGGDPLISASVRLLELPPPIDRHVSRSPGCGSFQVV